MPRIPTQTKPAAKSAGGNPPRFEIKKWNAVAMWSWDICADTVSTIARDLLLCWVMDMPRVQCQTRSCQEMKILTCSLFSLFVY